MRFRRDINGLRAWAVVLVALCHFDVAGFSAGFIGEDIFFVISGFLITSMIVNRLDTSGEAGGFSIWKFYVARASRILPALLILCVVLATISWFYLPQVEYQQLAMHTVAALSFLSNFVFLKEICFFDPGSQQKFLLHSWSLSIECQFYFMLPLLLVVAWKIRPSRSFLFWMLVLSWVASFALSVYLNPTKSSTAFFMLPTRAWEMLSGCLVFMMSNYFAARSVKTSKALEAFGWLGIVAALVLFDQETKWPGWQALFPVVGTALIILSSRENSVVTRASVAQWIGLRSYSIYLWHWPIMVVLIYLDWVRDPAAIILCIVLSLFLGAVSFHFIERPCRKELAQFDLRMASTSLVILPLLVCGLAAVIIYRHGMAGRIPIAAEEAFMAMKYRHPRTDYSHASCKNLKPFSPVLPRQSSQTAAELPQGRSVSSRPL